MVPDDIDPVVQKPAAASTDGGFNDVEDDAIDEEEDDAE